MKKILLIIIAVVALCACGDNRRVQSSEQSGESSEQQDSDTLPKDFVANVTAVGDEVELAANGKLAKKTSGTAIGEVVRIYTWKGQQSVMIRFY